jgi:uncharacterized Zn-binding protein involved in type VI secretion
MMGELNLKGTLSLVGPLDLKDKVLVDGKEALIQLTAPSSPQHGTAPPVNLPPPPAGPADPGPKVWVINSFNQTVKANGKAIVTQGMAMQGNVPTWPGMVLPSSNNPTVKANQIAICVVGDKAVILPSGGSATFSSSGQ